MRQALREPLFHIFLVTFGEVPANFAIAGVERREGFTACGGNTNSPLIKAPQVSGLNSAIVCVSTLFMEHSFVSLLLVCDAPETVAG